MIAIKSCFGRTSERIGVIAFKPSRNTKKFCVKTLTTFKRKRPPHLKGPSRCSMEEVAEGVHQKYSSLDQCHKHKDSMVRAIKSPFLNTPQQLDVDNSKVHPLVRNLFQVIMRQAPLTGRLKFYSEIEEN